MTSLAVDVSVEDWEISDNEAETLKKDLKLFDRPMVPISPPGPDHFLNQLPSLHAAGKDEVLPSLLVDSIGEGLGDLVGVKAFNELDTDNVDPGFTGVVDAGSYSWMGDYRPTIIVPGHPPVYKNAKGLSKLDKDRNIPGAHGYTDYDAFRLERKSGQIHCLEPVFHAISDPHLLHDLDIITDNGNLRKFFTACLLSGSNTVPVQDEDEPEELRIDAQRTGPRTIIFKRWEPPARRLPLSAGYSRHLAFLHHTTTPSIAGLNPDIAMTTLVRYKFAGLDILCRASADTTTQDPDDQPIPISSTAPLDGKTFTVSRTAGGSLDRKTLRLVKTRLRGRERDLTDYYGQMAFSQCSGLILVEYKSGGIIEGVPRTLSLKSPELKGEARKNAGTMRMVGAILRYMVAVMKHAENERISFLILPGKEGWSIRAYKGEDVGSELSDFAKGCIGVEA